MRTRREALVTLSAVPAAAQQGNHPHPGHDPEDASAPRKAQVLGPEEMEVLASLVDLVIPRSETPGARDAGVHYLIDGMLAAQADAQPRFRKGIAPFKNLSGTQRLDRLTALSAAQDPFFRMLKDMTIDAYYSTREGLVQELGWKGYSPLASFPGCTHPEHQE